MTFSFKIKVIQYNTSVGVQAVAGSVLSRHLDTLLQERLEQVVGGLCQPECLDDVELSKPDGKSSLGKCQINMYQAEGVNKIY